MGLLERHTQRKRQRPVAPAADGPLFNTKLHSVRELNASDLADKQQRVLNALKYIQPASRQEIAKRLGWQTSSVCGRVKELIDAGQIKEEGTRFDEVTNRPQKLLVIVIDEPG